MNEVKRYYICYKDEEIFSITEKGGEVIIYNEDKLPFDIYIEESMDFDDRVNNVVNFNAWCASRILDIDRKYAKEILNHYGFAQSLTDSEKAKIAIETRCLSLNDCFWLKKEGENKCWKEVNLFDNSLENSVFEIALFGTSPTVTNSVLATPDLSTDGKAPKAWVRNGKNFYLLKGNVEDSVTREVEASQILALLGIENVGYEFDLFNNATVSKCLCFTSENVNFVRAYWFDIWCQNHDKNIEDYILRYKEDFDKMNLADYLIGNDDEHPFNWGFLYDDDFNIIGLSPLMDYDHAFKGNAICGPVRYLGQNYIDLESVAKDIVARHPDWLDYDIDLSEFEYGKFVEDKLDILKGYLRSREIDIAIKDEFKGPKL